MIYRTLPVEEFNDLASRILYEDNHLKNYWALVCAEPKPAAGTLEEMMWRNEKQNKSYICRPGSARKDAAGKTQLQADRQD